MITSVFAIAITLLLALCAHQQNQLSIMKEQVSKMIMIMGDLETSRRLADEESPTSSSPFTCSGDWCTAEDKYFLFPKGVIIGKRNTDCTYGKGILSVDHYNDV